MLGPVQTNCYFVYREREDGQPGTPADPIPCILFDPADRGAHIYEELTKRGFRIELILLTHAHFDHISGANELIERSGAPLYCWEEEKNLCCDTDANLSADYNAPVVIHPDKFLTDNAEIEAAGMKCTLIGTPGHTEGSCCYYFKEVSLLISGDTLFEGSVGRTDFPTGSMSRLVRSIHERLIDLPDNTIVLPGHGGATTIGDEKQFNSYF